MTRRLQLATIAMLALSSPAAAQGVDPGKLRDAALAGDTLAWEIVEGLTTEVGQRLAGTEAEARGRAWAVRKLTALGFSNVHVESFTMPVWVRGEERAQVLGGSAQQLIVAALGNSGSTGDSPLEADIVYFPTITDLQAASVGSLTGKIAFIDHAMTATQDGSQYGAYGAARRQGPSIAASKGAAAVLIRSIGTDQHRNPHTGITNWAPNQAPIAAAALSNPDADQLVRLQKRGAVRIRLTLTPRFTGQGESGNVVADLPGTDPAAGIILVGGHLDSWDLGTGAIDDGAGLAITTAAAKRVHDAGPHRRTIRVVWFGAEEPGGFGGEAYARAHATEYHVMAGESDEGADRVWRFASSLPPANKPLETRMSQALAPLGIGWTGGVTDFGTDVGPIIRAGSPGVGLQQSALRYFDYHHTPDDTLDKIDLAQLRQNVAAWTTVLAVVALASDEIGSPPRENKAK